VGGLITLCCGQFSGIEIERKCDFPWHVVSKLLKATFFLSKPFYLVSLLKKLNGVTVGVLYKRAARAGPGICHVSPSYRPYLLDLMLCRQTSENL